MQKSAGTIALILGAASLFVSQATLASGGITPDHYPDADLINDGRRIFFEETFDGNGRTCGSCHAEEHNFTIDAKLIATLKNDDPLFLAEHGGALSENFEKPELMRKVGLILANTNGFDNPDANFTMRSVPHLLAMRTSLTPPSSAGGDGTSVPPHERTGWSGDGSPSNINEGLFGTMRDFTVGAVTQHFPKTPAREVGVDFRLPTEYELDAVLAFMLSLGRQEEFDDLNTIVMTDERAEHGRLAYMGEGVAGPLNCNACHFNGGANTNPEFDFPASITPPAFEMTNRSFAPRGDDLLDQHGDLITGVLPEDDGFGEGTFLFNAPSVIEAADTAPFFHANSIDTVEGMVAFYAARRILRDGTVLDPIVEINGPQIVNIAAFVRVLNADENTRSAIDLIDRAQQLNNRADTRININIAISEIEDAIMVLDAANLHFAVTIPRLEKAKRHLKDNSYDKAIRTLASVRDTMIIRESSFSMDVANDSPPRPPKRR
jgi:cytochrome c peroxidase